MNSLHNLLEILWYSSEETGVRIYTVNGLYIAYFEWNEEEFTLGGLMDETERLVVDILTQESPNVEEDEETAASNFDGNNVVQKGEKIIFGCATSCHGFYDAILYITQCGTDIIHKNPLNSQMEVVLRPISDDIESISLSTLHDCLQDKSNFIKTFKSPRFFYWDLFHGCEFFSSEFEALVNEIRTAYVLESCESDTITQHGAMCLRSLIYIFESTKVILI